VLNRMKRRVASHNDGSHIIDFSAEWATDL